MLKEAVKTNEEKQIFQLFFLREDENHGVEVEEVEEVNFDRVKRALERGESVFITRKSKPKLNITSGTMEEPSELWYFNRI